ncbi:MAG: helix-turn-helix domain-containing protein [Dactylosporangium sp.]|nr:helix-turn-helix domain-containing protein [Dactylosporangium sp.]NNJ60228.1 helix-turn-helix domain-containing protein [Dactylosporangium sp.]
MVSTGGSDRSELAARLRELRERAEISTTRLGSMLGWSQSKVSKIENGRTRPAVADVQAWLDAVDAPADLRAELLDMAESIQVASVIWNRTLPGGRAGHQRSIGKLRDESTRIRLFQNTVVPGLLQTAEYTRRVLTLGDVFGLGDTARAAATRIDRQTTLYEDAKRFEFIVTEAALRFRLGPPAVLAAQYDKLLSTATLPSVTLTIIPTDRMASTVHAHPFTIYDLPDGSAVVTIETYTRELTLTDPEEARLYQRVYDTLRADALHDKEVRGFLTSLRDRELGG